MIDVFDFMSENRRKLIFAGHQAEQAFPNVNGASRKRKGI